MFFSIPTLCSYSVDVVKEIVKANACPTSQSTFHCDCFQTTCHEKVDTYDNSKCPSS